MVFKERHGSDVRRELQIRCGRCIGCRLHRSQEWAIRCVHEMKLHKQNCWITLTYDDKHLPAGGSLRYPDFQKFLKRFRKLVAPASIRFYMCGEYGDELGRPHYHACIFGYCFDDLKPWRKSSSGFQLFRSARLEKLWKFGNAEIGELNHETAAYTARYTVAKITGTAAEAHYAFIDKDSGEEHQRAPEFNRCSLRPGIGAGHFERFMDDIFPTGMCVSRGRQVVAPRFYCKLYEKFDPEGYEEMILRRAEVPVTPGDFTRDRLAVQEKVLRARLKFAKRDKI